MTDSQRTWTDSDDYSSTTTVETTPHGVFRAVVTVDEYPDAPYFDAGDPVLRLSSGMWGTPSLEDCVYGNDILDAGDAWSHFAETTGNVAETFARWLRIFHDGTVTQISSHAYQGGDSYLVYTCRELAEANECDMDKWEPREPETSEWQAFIDGDVYMVEIERAVSFDEDGEPDGWANLEGPTHGYYGEDYAKEAAIDELKGTIAYVGRDMLPV